MRSDKIKQPSRDSFSRRPLHNAIIMRLLYATLLLLLLLNNMHGILVKLIRIHCVAKKIQKRQCMCMRVCWWACWLDFISTAATHTEQSNKRENVNERELRRRRPSQRMTKWLIVEAIWKTRGLDLDAPPQFQLVCTVSNIIYASRIHTHPIQSNTSACTHKHAHTASTLTQSTRVSFARSPSLYCAAYSVCHPRVSITLNVNPCLVCACVFVCRWCAKHTRRVIYTLIFMI